MRFIPLPFPRMIQKFITLHHALMGIILQSSVRRGMNGICFQFRLKRVRIIPSPRLRRSLMRLFMICNPSMSLQTELTRAEQYLISTTGYPIEALLEEFNLGFPGRDKIFQPHVPGVSSAAPAYGQARFIHDGMDVLFLAATDTSGGNYDYNVYSMSDVTGSKIKQLTHLKGMTTDLKVLPDGKATFVNGGVIYVLDIGGQIVKPL